MSRLNQFHSCFAIFSLFLTAVIHAINMINPIISASAAPRPEYFIFAGLVFTPLTVDASAAIDQPRALLEMPGGEKRLLVKFAKISPPNMFRQLFMMDSSHLSLSLCIYKYILETSGNISTLGIFVIVMFENPELTRQSLSFRCLVMPSDVYEEIRTLYLPFLSKPSRSQSARTREADLLEQAWPAAQARLIDLVLQELAAFHSLGSEDWLMLCHRNHQDRPAHLMDLYHRPGIILNCRGAAFGIFDHFH